MTTARLAGELLVFGLGLAIPLWASQEVTYSSWVGLASLAGIYLLLGATPLPWTRRPLLLGVAAFLVPFGLLGWISWRMEYFFIFERPNSWQNLPRMLFGLKNVGVAALLCGLAVTGAICVRGWARRRRRTTG